MKNKIYICLLIVFLIIIFISVGFASSSVNLNINNIFAKVRLERDIRITGVRLNNVSTDTISKYSDYNIDNVSLGFSLPYEDSYVSYNVSVTNIGNVEMGVFSISGLPDNLEYSLSNYKIGDKLCNENGECTLGASKEFIITLKYKSGGYVSNDIDYDIVLNFEFRGFYNVSYQNIVNDNYPNYAINGGDFNLTFINDIPATILIYDGLEYSYNSPNLIVNDVDRDFTIIGIADENDDYIITPDVGDSTLTIVDNNINSSNPILIDNFMLNQYGGINLSDRIITSIEVILSYSTSVGADQSMNCVLTVDGVSKTQTISLRGKTTSDTSVSFTDINIPADSTFTIKYTAVKTNSSTEITGSKIIVNFS